jgi:outer membrane protein insertion porin family
MAGVRNISSPLPGNAALLGAMAALPVLGLLLSAPTPARAAESPVSPTVASGSGAASPPAATPVSSGFGGAAPALAQAAAPAGLAQGPAPAAAPAAAPATGAAPAAAPAAEPSIAPAAVPADAGSPPATPPGAAPAGAATPGPADGAPGTIRPQPGQIPVAAPIQPGFEQPQAAKEPRVLISEVVIEGLDGHPERERLELAAYGAMTVLPGTEVTRSELRNDLQAIYATGWFSDVRIQPVDSPLGVRLKVMVTPNPVLTRISLDPPDAKVPAKVVDDTFAGDIGKTLNLNTLQTRMQELQKWYGDQGYSLARVTGPGRVSPEGEVQLVVRQGTVEGVEVQFLTKDGSTTNDKGQTIRGKTKLWVITREISLRPGQVFNRRNLEEDLKRLYGTGLFSDVKVTLRPVPEDPGRVTIVLGIVEQSTGSLSGGLGYSQSQGVFGQVQLQDSNLLGRAWDVATSFTYGQFGGLADITFTDPWIKGDPYRTAIRIKAFVSRDVPQMFQSQNNGNIYTASEFYQAPGTNVAYNVNSPINPTLNSYDSVTAARAASESLGQNNSWFNYNGNTVVLQRVGANLQAVRPLNGGNPFKRVPWSVVVGLSGQQVTPMNFSGEIQPYGVSTNGFDPTGSFVPTNNVICIAYNCANHNQLLGVRVAATMNTLNDPRNPTRGNFLSLGTEQFISVGPDSPTFNRLRASFTHYIPVKWLKLYKGCRPKPGQTEDCKQALAFQVSAGSNVGNLPTYEAFCLGGGNSVRGYYDCDLGVGRSFGEATLEYRFPLFSIVSGEIFVDGGTTFGSQANVPGNPGALLLKPGQGFSVGTGLIVTTPVGPLRLEVASQDFTGEWRFNLGVGWKF